MEGVRKLLNDEQLIALGCVTAESAQLESTLTWILAAVLGDERKDQFKKLLKGGFAEKLDALTAAGLAHIPPGQDNEDFETLTIDIGALYEQRDTAVHGIWIPRGGYELPEIGEVMTERYKLGEAEALKISKKVSSRTSTLMIFAGLHRTCTMQPRISTKLGEKTGMIR
jgi:hypothetical protein